MVPVENYLIVSGLLFAIGAYGVLARRNAVLVLMSIELMLNAVNVNLVAFSTYVGADRIIGQIFALFVVIVAAAEVGLALAIIIQVYRSRASANIDDVDSMRW
ncbi:MAG: NADH-quinone oxidoreductase subunit NuoK [Chloroflexota bacterium]